MNFQNFLIFSAKWWDSRTGGKKRLLLGGGSLLLAGLIWAPLPAKIFYESADPYFSLNDNAPRAIHLSRGLLEVLENPRANDDFFNSLQRGNPEWNLMTRTFLVGAMSEMSLRNPREKAKLLPHIDLIIADTLRLEKSRGTNYFLLPYASRGPWQNSRVAGSQFLDGEIALMLAYRRVLEENEDLKKNYRVRADRIKARMESSPTLSAESYPDEGWLFCNSMALAALRVGDYLDGTDHNEFFKRWILAAGKHLTDPDSGLLISSFSFRGQRLDGPEGSSIWASLHFLRLIDEDFARAQYRLARNALGRNLLGFAWAREWPASKQNGLDIDSGMVLPGLDLGPASSGLAPLAAASFGDREFFEGLLTSLNLGGFARESGVGEQKSLRYLAAGPMGEATLLYAMTLGPLWEKIKNETKEEKSGTTYEI